MTAMRCAASIALRSSASTALPSCRQSDGAEAAAAAAAGGGCSSDANAGRKAWASEEPTSPKVKQSQATAIRAVWAAAGAPPSDAAVAAHKLCIDTLIAITKTNGTKPRIARTVASRGGRGGRAAASVGGGGGGSGERRPRRASTPSSSAIAASWDKAVAHAAPAMPHPSRLTSTKSPPRLRSAASATASMGVRASLPPMQTACATVETTTAGSAAARMATYLAHSGASSAACAPQ
mmetsp:Transcript_18162/g.58495  ORF Transcript_18162/g.58495 Transcript_18162/m.58495 type:complete len:236 (+) Transcript_18162:1041-1748(+)